MGYTEKFKTSTKCPMNMWRRLSDIAHPNQKLGGNPCTFTRCRPFLDLWDSSEWMDLTYTGTIHRCRNKRGPPNTVYKRLDGILFNTTRKLQFPQASILPLLLLIINYYVWWRALLGRICTGHSGWKKCGYMNRVVNRWQDLVLIL